MLDTPSAHAFSIADEEFIAGTPASVADDIIAQCREVGAGHFAALFDRSTPLQHLMAWYRDYGAVTIPRLREAAV